MGYGVYENGERFAGYAVPAICEHPGCNKKIDRGYAYACGGEPFSERGCDRYFCSEHLWYHNFNIRGSRECVQVCARCNTYKSPFPYKPEKEEWLQHILNDESWSTWREENPEKVNEFKNKIKNKEVT